MVGPQRGPRRSRGESEDVWRQIGDLLVRGHAQTEARFDRLEGCLDPVEGRLDDVDGRLDDVDGRLERIDGRLDRLESDMGDVKGQLNRLEVGYERGFKRIDAQFERLTALIIRHETRRPTDGDPLPDTP
jgi:chaperonin cofactor prefoldin